MPNEAMAAGRAHPAVVIDGLRLARNGVRTTL
jgi:hypothetical protein